MINSFDGMPLIESVMCTKGISSSPKRRNKSKRIQKKWNKVYGYNYTPIPDPNLYMFGNSLIGHPVTIKKVIKAIDKENSVREDFINKFTGPCN